MSRFTHLHVHSHYSLLDGLSKIPDLVSRAKELGMEAVAVTDHGNLYGAVEFYKEAKKQGIKAILGAEIYLAFEGMEQQRPGIDDKRYHLILLVKNEKGYRNLVQLLTAAHLKGFYYKPRVDEDFLRKHAEGLIALSACLSGKIPKHIAAGNLKEAEETALRYEDIFGKGNFYLELQRHPNIPEQDKVNPALLALSRKTGIPVVATADSHYLRPEDNEAQDVLMAINAGVKSEDSERLTLKADDFSLKSPGEMTELFSDIPEAIENTSVIAEACDFEFKLGASKLPPYPLPAGKTGDEYLKELCLERMVKKPQYAGSKEAEERLLHELSVIEQTGFASYFLIVQDFVNWAKTKHIVVGPGRGSVGGSLVAYVLGITNIDPLRYNLLFERFLTPDRISMPDIDLDFADHRRDEVIGYVAEKYGRDRVAQIITFGTMAARAAIRDVGRALGYEYGYCDRVAKMIPFSYTLSDALEKTEEFSELYRNDRQAERLIDLAKKLEGVARHASTHACGVVISAEPLDDSVPLQHPTQNEHAIVTQYEMHSVEDLGHLKMDFLGLKNLSTIEETLQRIYAVHKVNVDIENIPQDDKKVYQLLRKGETSGVFQLESSGMRRYLQQLKPTEFEDIIAMVALYRPGPMELIPEYIARKHGRKEIEYLHPKLKEILQNTQGICIYQEQLMRIAQDLAGFSLAEADVLRKAVGKKIESLLLEQKEKMVQGMIGNGIGKASAAQIWEWMLPFARYGFNRSHSAAYATIAYETAWLKANYPVEFMSALMTGERNDVERVAFLISETRKMGIEVQRPDINESFSHFSVVPGKKEIRFGLLAIKNVGEGAVNAIIEERKAGGSFTSMQNFVERVSSRDLNRKATECLIKAGVFDSLGERNQLLFNTERLLEVSREHHTLKEAGQKGLFEGTRLQQPDTLKLEPTEPASEQECLSWEKEFLGLYVSSHPLKRVESILAKRALSISKLDPTTSFRNFTPEAQRTRIAGIISSIKKIMTKTGKPMLFLNLEDLTDKIEVVVFPSVIEQYSSAFQENAIVFVTGHLDKRNGERKFIAEDIEPLVETNA